VVVGVPIVEVPVVVEVPVGVLIVEVVEMVVPVGPIVLVVETDNKSELLPFTVDVRAADWFRRFCASNVVTWLT
jgi:hypothetical protein